MSDKEVISSERKKPSCRLILLALIIVQLIYSVVSFAVFKEGMYGDEPWGYGLANSYYQPFIYAPDGMSIDNIFIDDVINFDTWVDGEVFNNYLTVQKGERFAYGSVVHNQTLDHHPPLYYMALHTVCSFFPDKFSLWYGFLMQCGFMAVTMIFLYRLCGLTLKSEPKALIACLLYGGSSGALATVTYVRQYCLLTTFIVMFMYYAARLYYDGGAKLKRLLPCAGLASMAAFFTHYYSVMFIGLMTAMLCVFFLCKKQIKKMFAFGLTELVSLGAFVLLYPAVITQIKSSDVHEDHILSYFEQLNLTLSYLLRFSVGIRVALMKTANSNIAFAVFVIILAVCVPLGFLFRKEKWFIKAASAVKGYLKALAVRIKGKKSFDFFILFIFITVLAVTLFVNYQVDTYYYETSALRYMFMLIPFVCMTVFFAADKLLRLLIPPVRKHINSILAVLTVLVLVRVNIVAKPPYYGAGAGRSEEITDALAGKNCLLVLEGQDSQNMLSSLTAYISKTAHTYPVMEEAMPKQADSIISSEYGKDIDYLIVSNNNYSFSREQHDAIADLLKNSRSIHKPEQFRCDDGEEEKDPDIILDDNIRDELFSDTTFMDSIERICPKNSYTPVYIISINGFAYVVLSKT